MDRYVVISSDCHGGPPDEVFRPYIPAQHLEKFDEYIRRSDYLTPMLQSSQDDAVVALVEERTAEGGGWYRDASRRLTELADDGIVAEVIFPTLQQEGAQGYPPFLFLGFQYGPELQLIGVRAWNRWLAEFCAEHPDRQAGIGIVTPHDIETAVAETRWCKEAGLRGVSIVGEGEDLEPWNHPRYEPLWAAVEECGFPLHVHIGLVPNPGTPMGMRRPPRDESRAASFGAGFEGGPGAQPIRAFDLACQANAPLWVLIYGLVLERHPNMSVVFTEQGAAWVTGAFAQFQRRRRHDGLPRDPQEYWDRQCYLGASVMTRLEAELRDFIGVDKIMWGSDYPHYEGSWPHTKSDLAETFRGVPVDETRKMLGENAAALYGFDMAHLAGIAAAVGPKIDEIMNPLVARA